MGRRRIIWLAVLGTLAVFQLQGQTYTLSINSTAAWAPLAEFTGVAGEDYPASFESAANEYRFTVSRPGPPSTDPYEVTVRRQDTVWNAGLTLDVRRTGDGGGGGTISGGLSYQEIGTTDAPFWTGTGRKNNIPVQLRISGAFGGAGIPAGTYTTTVIYTITDT